MNDKQNQIQIFYKALVLCALLWSGVGLNVYANTLPTQNFESWKLKQEKHDLRLQHQSSSAIAPTIANKAMPLTQSSVSDLSVPVQQVLGTSIRVNINTATAQELSAKLDSIGTKKAKAIISYRNKYGKFNKVEDLKRVKGIGEKIFEKNRDRIKLTD